MHRFLNKPRDKRYGYQHHKQRKIAAQRHNEDDPCVRCGMPLGPMGPWLHYDHDDDGVHYLGFSHGHCNTRAGAIRGNAMQYGHAESRQARRTRSW